MQGIGIVKGAIRALHCAASPPGICPKNNNWDKECQIRPGGVPETAKIRPPSEVAAGHKPQFEKAVQVVMEELKANPPKKLVRSPFPIRVK